MTVITDSVSLALGRALKDQAAANVVVGLIEDVNTIIVYNSALAGSPAAAAKAIIAGLGTSAAPVKNSTADGKFFEFRCKTEATSGDNRLWYSRYEMGGANPTGGGEALRTFTALTAAVGTAHGGHVSLNVSDTGYISGLGAGFRGQLLLADAAIPDGGTYYGMLAEIYCEGDGSDISGATAHAVLAVHADGDATGAAKVLNAISFKGGADSGGGQMISPGTSMGTVQGTIRVLINGVAKYIPYYGHEGHA